MTVPVSEVTSTIKVSEFEPRARVASDFRTENLYKTTGKRVLDVALVLLSSIIVLPLISLLAAIIWVKGGSPFYVQRRVGRGGQSFNIYKLRTMVADSDELLAKLVRDCPETRHEWNTTQKLKDDPRITPFGRFLRKSSLDELPQLLNVLLGDMSLVGPRPMMESQVALYPGHAYYRLRPGVTGFWQICDRNACDFADRAKFDDAYDRTLSLGTDVRVLAQTVGVVLRGTGY
jgi:lipopolysaccharide/colanic/teichoic acid biosynthesis glycosyltransferase